jgi:3-hydroxybutyryl-CoA dehydrogenase
LRLTHYPKGCSYEKGIVICYLTIIKLFQVNLQICFVSPNPETIKPRLINLGFYFVLLKPFQWGFFCFGKCGKKRQNIKMEVGMQEKEIKNVAVIGAGLMGFGIGLEFARFGYEVRLYNTKEASSRKAMALIREDLDLMVETQLLTAEEAEASYKRLHPTTDLVKAASGADYVIESIPEILNLKIEVFAKLDEICPPPAILATNTSNFMISELLTGVKHPERALVTHYFGPPHFIPLVEVVKGAKTDPKIVEKVAGVLRGLRKKVIVINIELPAHGANRLQHAMSREIHALVDKGIQPTEVDDLIKFGFGRRMPFIGYFQRMDYVGIDGRMERHISAGQQPWGPMAERVKRGELGVKTGKGFYEWPGDSAKHLVRYLNRELIRLMKHDMEEGTI